MMDGFVEVTPILRSGVYALVAKGTVIYIGKSKKMLARIDSHRRAWVDKRRGQAWLTESLGIPALRFDQIYVLPVPLHELDRVESEMIDRYKPRYNTQLKSTQAAVAEIKLNVGGVPLTLNAKSERMVVERRV